MEAYIYQADTYCPTCTEEIKKGLTPPEHPEDERTFDSDDYPKGPFADGGGEADTPNHCAKCHCHLENPLTHDGYKYVKEYIMEAIAKNDVLQLWFDFYEFEISHP